MINLDLQGDSQCSKFLFCTVCFEKKYLTRAIVTCMHAYHTVEKSLKASNCHRQSVHHPFAKLNHSTYEKQHKLNFATEAYSFRFQ